MEPLTSGDLEAAALYDLLGSQVAPLFYDRGEDGVPTRWMSMVRHTLSTLGPKVQASRMVREYVESYYRPAATMNAAAAADGYAGARGLAGYRARLDEAWPKVRVTGAEIESDGRQPPVPGTPVPISAWVDLAGLSEAEVTVQAVLGHVDDEDELHDVVIAPMGPDGTGRYSVQVPLPHTGTLGFTVRVLPRHDLLATPAELGRVVLA